MKLSFVEELLLLGIDDDSGRVRLSGELGFSMALAGAVLAELVRRGRIDSNAEKMWLLDATPTGEAVLDRVLQDFESATGEATPQHWVQQTYGNMEEVMDLALKGLIDKGILRQEEGRLLWLFSELRYPTVEGKPEREVKHRLFHVIFSDDTPTPDDVTLLALCRAGGVLESILSQNELQQCADRIDEVAKGDLISAAAVDIVEEVTRQMAMSAPLG